MLQLLNKNNREQSINCINSKIAIVAALEVLGGEIICIIVTIPIVQEAEAGCERQGRITLTRLTPPRNDA
jgi:hypothetical protein